MNIRIFQALLCLALALCANAKADTSNAYAIDPIHTRVAFRVMHAGLSPSIGTVSKPEGRIVFDEKNPEMASVTVTMPLDTLDLGDAGWNRKVLGSFLNAEKYPNARFQSTRVTVLSEHLLRIEGTLEIAGGQQTISMLAIINGLKRHPLTFKKTLGLQATADFSRSAMGINAWSGLVGDSVHLDIAVEATLDRTEPEVSNP